LQNININLIDNNTGQLDNVPQNPRDLTNDGFELAKKSIIEFPEMLQVRTLVVVPKDDRYVTIGGNQRLRAMRDLEYTEAPCMVVDWNSDQIQRFIIADNLEYGVWNYDMLANDWDAEQLIEWGLDLQDYEEQEVEGLTDEDDIPELQHEPVTKLGDLWLLGEHRLLCGDSFCVDSINKLTNNKQIDLIYTDPMYNDNPDDFINSIYAINSDNLLLMTTFTQGLTLLKHNESLRFRFDLVLYFKTPSSSMNKKVPYYYHKNLLYITKANDTIFNCDNAKGSFSEKGYYPSVIEAKKNTQEIHGLTKPVEAVELILSGFKAKTIIDIFAGSGTTLIACEKTNRISYNIELDPKYCDVIIKRWQEYTGKQAILENTKQKFNELLLESN
jgi:DNA modification methylase